MKERRFLRWIDYPRQSKFVTHLLLTSVISGCFMAISLYSVAWLNLRALESLGLRSLIEVRHIFLLASLGLIMGYLLIQGLLISLVFWVGKRISHRLAGPIIAIQKRLLELKDGDFTTHFKIRKKDFLHTLVQELESLRVHLHQQEQGKSQQLEKIKTLSSHIHHPSLKSQFENLLDDNIYEKAA